MKEQDIRPERLFDEFIRLNAEDAREFFGKEKGQRGCCPVHLNAAESEFFCTKFGFEYRRCVKCDSIFVDPAPTSETLIRFYKEGKAPQYWESLYKNTREKRKELVFKHKAEMMIEDMSPGEIKELTVIDIGGGYGIFADVVSQYGIADLVIVEPNDTLAKSCRKQGYKVVSKFMEECGKGDFPGHKKIFTCFEVLEHLSDPRSFLSSIYDAMEPDDRLFMTALTASGIDIRLLGERSKAVLPPQHLTFLSVEGMEKLLSQVGFRMVDVSTPGRLDCDILKNQIKDMRRGIMKSLIENLDAQGLAMLQGLISSSRLSSHMLIRCKK